MKRLLWLQRSVTSNYIIIYVKSGQQLTPSVTPALLHFWGVSGSQSASFQRAVPASSWAAPCRSYVDLHGLPRCLPAKFWAYSLVIEELWKPPISFHGLAIQTWWFSIYVKLPKTISRICLIWYLAYTWQIQNDISTVRYASNLRRSSLDVDIRTDLGIPASESSPESLANHRFSMLLIWVCLKIVYP